ncbi:MAG: M20/M25/M40 family metallo-hydrolase, partial [Gemmatimonadaceae bacterium]|jgi:acetylornithine deacetylase/succinyl-diaminopimelate desuccinylase-like protein|nr:M20/M25/M40 family metallo-hydrolase [Gemmatimonadaceae bacterium]
MPVLPVPAGAARRSPSALREALAGARAHLVARNARIVEWQEAVTRIAAPTGQEQARGAWMAARFRELGWRDVRTDGVGNVIARRGTAPAGRAVAGSVWCCAHLDTVFPDTDAIAVTRRGLRSLGPGIGDNGRGLAALLALADVLTTLDVHTPREIVLVATVGEEGLGDLRGMKQLLGLAGHAPAAVIAVDGAGDDRVVNGALGATRWRITFTGPGGHSWADWGAPNPVHAAADAAARLAALPLPSEPRTTLTVARIGGGETINSIPRDGWLEVDIRSADARVLRELGATLRTIVRAAERAANTRRPPEVPALVATIAQLGDRPCGVLAETHPLVTLACDVTTLLGVTPRLATGSTDASVAIARGIPAIAIGAGGTGGGVHTREEWYDDLHGPRGLERVLLIAVGAASE